MVDFNVLYEGDETSEFRGKACFGVLRNFFEYLEWEGKEESVPVAVEFLIRENHVGTSYATARKWWKYLDNHPLWKQAFLERENLKLHEGYKTERVTVSTDVDPHLMLNTLSMYRMVGTHPEQVSLWDILVDRGLNKDVACVAAMFLTPKLDLRTEDGEHTVFGHDYTSVESIKNYALGVLPENSHLGTFSEERYYNCRGEHPVVGWLNGYGFDKSFSEELFPSVTLYEYDTEKEELTGNTKEQRLQHKSEDDLINHLDKLFPDFK